MSRAFVNEDSAAAQADQPVERTVSDQPNYVTQRGLELLADKVAQLQALAAEQQALGDTGDSQRLADLQRDLRYYSQRLQSAQVVMLASSTQKVQIGNWVTFADEQGKQQRIQLVGEDQADAHAGLINWSAPLGRAVLGARRGDEVSWKRPKGDQVIEIIDIALP